MGDVDLDALNRSEDYSRKYEKVTDNQTSMIKGLISDGICIVQGSEEDLTTNDVENLIQQTHRLIGEKGLNLNKIFGRPTEKLNKVNVRENSSLADLTNAILKGEREQLPPAYYYRGLIQMLLGDVKGALNNFTEAIQCGFKGKEEYKLHHKTSQCYLKQKKYSKAREHLSAAVESLKKAKLSEKQKNEYKRILQESLQKISNKKDKPQTLDLVKNKHSQDPCLCAKVDIKTSGRQGRYAVANSLIKQGEVIFQDDGIAPFLNPDDKEKTSSYCLMCLVPVQDNPFPSYSCNSVVFCSPACRVAAEGSFPALTSALQLHAVRGRDRKDWYKIFSSLNIILSKPLEFWRQHGNQFLNPDSEAKPGPASVSNEIDRYNQLFRMVTHFSSNSDIVRIQHAVITIFLVRCVIRSKYFGNAAQSTNLTDDQILIGRLIYQLRLISESNCYPLWGVEVDESGQAGLENIGSGIYPGIGSYINSVCDPNTLRCNVGNTVIIIAARDIKEGEEITDNYCIHYSELPSHERSSWLQENFFFKCQCQACSENWGTYDELECSVPSALQKLLVPLEKENQAALRAGNVERALELHAQEQRLIEQHLAPPHQLFVSLRNSYQCCWWTKIAELAKSKQQ